MNKKASTLTAIAILLLGIGAAVFFNLTKPKPEKAVRPDITAVVECIDLTPDSQEVILTAHGTVIPVQSAQIKAQVNGLVEQCSEKWMEGSYFSEGEMMISIEKPDYETALASAQAQLLKAESALALERGRHEVAVKEWNMLYPDRPADRNDLAIRIPQLRAAEAGVASAAAEVRRAELNLQRTLINAPFNGVITSRMIDKGSLASPMTPVATMVSTEHYHIMASVPSSHIKWIKFKSASEDGSAAQIVFRDGTSIPAEVEKLLPDLEKGGRMARILVRIDEPLTLKPDILLGSFVTVKIKGQSINDSYKIKRRDFHRSSEIWLMNSESKLHIMPVNPIWSDRDNVIFKADIAKGYRLITSDLAIVIEGMDLKLKREESADKEEVTEK